MWSRCTRPYVALSRLLTDQLAYYDSYIGPSRDIFRLIITHPDVDHLNELSRLRYQDPQKRIFNFWHTGPHDFNRAHPPEEDWPNPPHNKRDWETCEVLRSGDDGSLRSLQHHQCDTRQFGTEGGVKIWARTPAFERLEVDRDEPNIVCLLLKIG